jgi:hypothetical protein
MSTNIVSTTAIFGKTAAGSILNDGTNTLINPIGSGKVLRVGALLVANSTGTTNADVIVLLRRGGVVEASSIYFDASDNTNLNIANTLGALTFTGDFTLETWLYIESYPNNWGIALFDLRTSNNDYLWQIPGNTNRLRWTDSTGEYVSTVPFYLQRWTHLAICRSDNIVSFYVDGVKDIFSFARTGTITANSTIARIGRFYNSDQRLNGYINDLRVSDVARYTTGFTPHTSFLSPDANTKLLLSGNGTNDSQIITDSAPSPHAVTANGNVRIRTAYSAYLGQETRLAQRITVPASATLAVISKENPLYLEEGDRLVCFASTPGRLEYVCSYEEIV